MSHQYSYLAAAENFSQIHIHVLFIYKLTLFTASCYDLCSVVIHPAPKHEQINEEWENIAYIIYAKSGINLSLLKLLPVPLLHIHPLVLSVSE